VTDIFSEEKRSEVMSKIHSGKRKEDWTEMELKVHNWLKAKHIKHLMMPDIEENPDVMLRNDGDPIFLFLDGCFWHCCPEHYERPKSRRKYWREHIEVSSQRREERRRRLPYEWVRIWEHDVNSGEFKEIIEETLNG